MGTGATVLIAKIMCLASFLLDNIWVIGQTEKLKIFNVYK